MINRYNIEVLGNGTVKAEGEGVTVKLLEFGKMFQRRAVKFFATQSPQEVCWLVVELNGVRVYVDGTTITVTTKDLHP